MDKKFIVISSIIIGFLSLIVYSNSFQNDFVWDDEFLINHDLIKDIRNWRKILTHELLEGSKTDYYRPVQIFSYVWDYHFWGFAPFGYHLTNFLLHIFNAILVFLLIHSLIQRINEKSYLSPYPLTLTPLLTAIFWVVHPAHTESVSYISGRADLLAGFFILSAVLCYIFQFRAKKFKRALNLFSTLLFSLALFSKEASVIFPLFLIGYEFFFHRQVKQGFMRIANFILITAVYILMRLTILNFSGSYFWLKSSVASPVSMVRFFSFLKGLFLYLKMLALPENLHLENYIAPARSIFDQYVLAAILIICIFLLIFRKIPAEGRRFVIFGVFWFFIFLFPQSNFFFTFVLASHFLYLPSIGIFFALAYGFNGLYARKKYFTRIIVTALVIFWGIVTFSQNYTWRNSLSFYRWVDKLSPYSYLARNNLANLYACYGLDDSAIAEYEQALIPNYARKTMGDELGIIEDSFIEKYRDSLKRAGYSAVFYYNLAYLYQRKGRLDEAISFYTKAIGINHNFTEALSNLGNVYEAKGDFALALAQYRQAIAVEPGFAQGYFNIGVVLANQGNLTEAKEYFEKTLKINPGYRKAGEYLSQIEEMLKK